MAGSKSIGLLTTSQQPTATNHEPPTIQLHAVVLRPAAALRRHPGDDLIRIHDVARLAVHAVRCVDLQTRRLTSLADDFVDIGRTEACARVAVLRTAS